MPTDIKNIVLAKQTEVKINTGASQFSQQETIFKIVREWNEIVSRNKKFKEHQL